ncbi:integrase, catalytic region, zinc finger, CCHC-type containing protein, partial [Tanacetum coccineum]
MVQNVQRRQSQGYAGNAGNNQASGARVINAVGNTGANQPRVIRCYNCKGEGHMAKQCTARKRVKDSEWFKDKMLLAQAQEAGVVLDEEQQDFLADSLEETDDCEDLQLQATTNFKADHVDAYDSDCDDEATTNAIFMANLSPVGSLNDDTVAPRYDSDTLSEVPHYDTYHDSDMLNSNIQELGYIENIVSNNESYDELKGNNDVISYTDYMLTIGDDADNYVPPPVQKNDMMLSVIEQIKSQVEKCNTVNQEAKSVNESLTSELERYKDRFDECIKRRATFYPHEIGSWEQSDIKGAFRADVIPSSENLKETFKLFEKGFITEVKEMKDIFEQMEDEVDQTKFYSVTPLPKLKVIPKVVEKNDLSKLVNSHLTTKKIIEKYTKVLAPGHASKFAKRIQELLVYVSASYPFTQSGNEKWAPSTSHKKNNNPYIDASRTKQTIEIIKQKHAVKQNTRKTDNTMLPSIGR